MGCDIHVLTEAYKEKCGWYNVDNWRINPYYGEDEYEPKLSLNNIYTSRNYELFTLLADVRNYHDDIKCISEPRGIPEDLSEETYNFINDYGKDGHSHSWYTLKELYDYWLEMPNKTKRTGILVGEILEKFDKDGILPTEWCQGFWGNEKSAQRTWEVEYNPLDEFITCLIERFCDIFWIFGVNKEEYKTDERLKEAIQEKGENFRVVFFFDN